MVQDCRLSETSRFWREDEQVQERDFGQGACGSYLLGWVAESWQNTNVNLLRRSWKRLWPSLKFEEAPIPTPELLHFVQQLPGCEDDGEGCLEEQVRVDVIEE